MQKPFTLLVVVLVGGALAAGCGSSSSTSSTQASSSQTATQPQPLSPAAAAQARATCLQRVQAQASISASTKAKLEQICNQAATTNPTAIRKATQEACIALLNASHVPAGAARERALAVCRTP